MYKPSITRLPTVCFLLLLVVGVSVAATGSVAADTADITVATDGGGGDYTSIQNAIDNATAGDRIKVKSGTYEQHTDVNKNITLYAPEGATIANTSTVVSEYSKYEIRSGFQIYGDVTPTISGFTLTDWRWAISAGGSDGSWTVTNTKINGGECGVCAATTPGDWTIENSTVTNAETISAYQSTGDWEIANTTISNTDISADESTGDPTIKDTTIEKSDISADDSAVDLTVENTLLRDISSDGIKIEESTGSLTVADSTIQNITYGAIEAENTSADIVVSGTRINDSDTGIDFEERSTGDLTITSTVINNITYDAIETESSTGTITVQDTSVQTADNGIDAEKSDGRLIVTNFTVRDTDGDGIDASNATGDATVRESVFRNVGDKSVDVIDSEGKWEIHKSVLTAGRESGVEAWGAAVTVNASYNYWNASTGPSGEFEGSGSEVGGNIAINPYYTDADLTTLSTVRAKGAAPAIAAASDSTYDPSFPTTIGTEHNASGIIDKGDVAIRLVNTTAGDDTVVATNDSSAVPVKGAVNTTVPAGRLSGDVRIETQLYDTATDTVEARDTINLTATGSDEKTVSAPGGVTIPAKYTTGSDNSVGPGGLGTAASDFRSGEIRPEILGDVAAAFRNS
jgi:hypothetical protein